MNELVVIGNPRPKRIDPVKRRAGHEVAIFALTLRYLTRNATQIEFPCADNDWRQNLMRYVPDTIIKTIDKDDYKIMLINDSEIRLVVPTNPFRTFVSGDGIHIWIGDTVKVLK